MWYYILAEKNAVLAQLDRVTGYEPVGQGFESLAACQIKTTPFCEWFLFLYRLMQIKGFEGRVLNDVPGARQTAPPLLPQQGDSRGVPAKLVLWGVIQTAPPLRPQSGESLAACKEKRLAFASLFSTKSVLTNGINPTCVG